MCLSHQPLDLVRFAQLTLRLPLLLVAGVGPELERHSGEAFRTLCTLGAIAVGPLRDYSLTPLRHNRSVHGGSFRIHKSNLN